MKIILNHKHDGEIQFNFDRVNHLARVRTVDIDDVYGAVEVIDKSLSPVLRGAGRGLVVHVDVNSRHFPSTYSGIPMSTHFVLMFERRSWRFLGAARLRCGEGKRYEVVSLPDPMREELLRAYKSFDC